ncbi:MAG: AbrB/MazE/SpoVT family DNA-binding domain-containing protein [Patescibacteria group bacterium]
MNTHIAQTNIKGQLVIPKKMRDKLGIKPTVQLQLVLKEAGIFIQPVKEIITDNVGKESYLALLKKTQGSWQDQTDVQKARDKKKLELQASRKRKQTW